MPSIDVVLNMTQDECLAHYEGRFSKVRARSLDGRWVAFPAAAIRRVVGREGVQGVYRLTFSDDARLISIVPLPGRGTP